MSALGHTRAHWSGVLAMTLCVFVLIASEFMPVSLLTPIAGDLHITEGLAGQGIALSGALAVLTSLTISRLTGSLDRKWLLLGLTALMAASGVIIALASSFPVYMLGRALIGIVIGGFWSMSAATAIRLVPQRQVPRALAIFNGGNALATVVAAPLGSYLGATVGWRGAFLCLVPLAVLAFVWQCISLPSMKSPRAPQRQGSVLRLFRLSTLSLGLLACGLFFMGQFTLFTYVRPFLETVTQVSPSGLSLILLTMGIAGFIVGLPNIPELGSTTSLPVCYDLACPNCYSAYNISRALQLKEGGYAACVSCGRTYNLNNQGQISIGEEGVSLFRYRITYSGNTMVINNR